MENSHQIAVFEQKQIRSVEQDGTTWFVLVDIIEALSDSSDPKQYLEKLRKRDTQVDGYLRTNCRYVAAKGKTGKTRQFLAADTEGVLRIIQSVPSPKAEPFKLWMAGLGKQAIEEANDPELMSERQAEIYRAKGYPDDWIANRLKTIDIRKELTNEWKNRGVKEGQEYSHLTATIAKGTFGLTPTEHAKHKNLSNQNLRDHMTTMELILTALGEEVTRAMAVKEDAQGFNENHEAAVKGGEAGKKARQNVERIMGEKVVSSANFLNQKEKNKELEAGENTE